MRLGDWIREGWIDASDLARYEGLTWDVYVSESVIELFAPAGAATKADPKQEPPAIRTAWLRNVQSVVRGLALTIPNAKHGPFFCCTAWNGEGIEPVRAHVMLFDVRRDGAFRRYCVRPAAELHIDDSRRGPRSSC